MSKKKLREVCSYITDGEHGSVERDSDGTHFLLTAKNLIDGKIVFLPEERPISDSDFYRIRARTKLEKEDVVISTTGTIGNLAVVHNCDNYEFNRDVGVLKCNKDIILPLFLYYTLKSNEIQKKLLHISKGCTQKHLYIDDLATLEINVPIIEKQEQIVNALECLDKKIDLNSHLCAELETMAKTLYDYWFVQFDFPDENGKPYRTSGGAMEWCQELGGEVPKGWKIDKIDHIISIVRGVSYQPSDELSSLDEDSIKLLKSNNIQDGSINFDSPVYLPSEKANSEQWLTKGSVFITMSSGSKLHMGKTAIVFDDLPYVFGAFCAKIKIESLYQYWLAAYFRHELFRTHIENVTLGTSINNINAHHITSIKMAFPPKEVLERFNALLSPCFDMQGKIMKENTQLQSMRDWLLPMLMNGQAIVEK